VLLERQLDLSGLDTIPAELDLLVDAAEELEVAVREKAGPISRLIQTRSGLIAERVRDEALRRQVGALEIASGETGPCDVKLALDGDRHGLQMRVEHVDCTLGIGRPIGTLIPARGVPSGSYQVDVVGHLRRTVEIDDDGDAALRAQKRRHTSVSRISPLQNHSARWG